MQEYYDERSENWQESEKGEEMYDEIDDIENAVSSLEEAIDTMNNYI